MKNEDRYVAISSHGGLLVCFLVAFLSYAFVQVANKSATGYGLQHATCCDNKGGGEERSEPASKWGNFSDRVMAFFAVVVAGVAFAQWRTSDRQAETTRLQLETQRTELRAYVSTSIKGISRFNSELPLVFIFEAINHGRTPAKDVEFGAVVGITPNDTAVMPAIDSGWNPGRMNLFPNANDTKGDRGEISCNCNRIFNKEEIAQFRAGSHFIFIGLEIQYWDFIGNVGHVTRNYYRIHGHPAALAGQTLEWPEEVDVTGLSDDDLRLRFSIIPRWSQIT